MSPACTAALASASLASADLRGAGAYASASTALAIMERHTITALVVVDDQQRLAGVIHLHDLLKHGIV